jgi:NhaP-type Na+/H+ or K+/H+ antiporter
LFVGAMLILALSLTGITLTIVTVSIVVHGLSLMPLMNRYTQRKTLWRR